MILILQILSIKECLTVFFEPSLTTYLKWVWTSFLLKNKALFMKRSIMKCLNKWNHLKRSIPETHHNFLNSVRGCSHEPWLMKVTSLSISKLLSIEKMSKKTSKKKSQQFLPFKKRWKQKWSSLSISKINFLK